MNIDEMEAGRGLDALVWMALNGKSIEDGTIRCRYVDGDVQPHAGYPVGHISPPHYSTDNAAALVALDELKDSWDIEMGYADVTEDEAGFKRGWYVLLNPHEADGTRCDDWPIGYDKDNLAAAISRALLKAVTE